MATWVHVVIGGSAVSFSLRREGLAHPPQCADHFIFENRQDLNLAEITPFETA
jgi:hypothetical protein